MKQNKEDILKNKIILRKLQMKTQEISSRKKSNRPAKVSDSHKSPVRKKPARPVIKTVQSSKSKTCDIQQSKQSKPSKNIVKQDSLNTRQRGPLGSAKLKEKIVRSSDCKSLKISVGRKATTQQNSSSNVNKVCAKVKTRAKSLKMELSDVKVMSKQNIHNDSRSTRANRKTSTASGNYIPYCGPSGHPHSMNPGNDISAVKNSNCHAKDISVDKSNKLSIFNIEETILDMQKKILKLEQKSVLDDEKINSLKTIMLKQRNNEIKALLDEKENELLLRMDLLYVDYEPERVCKLCLQLFDKKENLTSLLSDPTVVSLINTTLDMEVELNDGTPTGLCNDCLLLIKRYDWMKRRSHKANTLSAKFVAIKKGYNGSDYPEKSPFAVATTSSDMYLLEHVIDEDITEEDQSFDSLKIENTFSLDTPGNVRIPLDLTFIKEEPQNEEDKLTSLVLTESVASHFKPKTVKKCRLCRTIFINQWTLNKHHAYCCQRFKCLECTKCFFDSRLFRLHKLRRQSCVSTDVFRYCNICNISFRWRWQLTFHIFNHK